MNLAKQLIGLSDVVIENFAAGVIERLGLGYDVLRAIKSDLIMVSSSGTGHSGPDKDYVAYGSLLQYYTGWNSISGYPDGEPIKGGLWADPWVGLELAMVTRRGAPSPRRDRRGAVRGLFDGGSLDRLPARGAA